VDFSGLLGPLENEIMQIMWGAEQATVRQVVSILQKHRPIAYTTVMTVMNNLVAKGLLRRSPQGKAYVYDVVLSREEFSEKASREAVSEVLARFGDLAVARFLEATAQYSQEDLKRLKGLAEGKQATLDGERNSAQ
jgi:predicted transcriptional regulator